VLRKLLFRGKIFGDVRTRKYTRWDGQYKVLFHIPIPKLLFWSPFPHQWHIPVIPVAVAFLYRCLHENGWSAVLQRFRIALLEYPGEDEKNPLDRELVRKTLR